MDHESKKILLLMFRAGKKKHPEKTLLSSEKPMYISNNMDYLNSNIRNMALLHAIVLLAFKPGPRG